MHTPPSLPTFPDVSVVGPVVPLVFSLQLGLGVRRLEAVLTEERPVGRELLALVLERSTLFSLDLLLPSEEVFEASQA